jgi:hypothetical protein
MVWCDVMKTSELYFLSVISMCGLSVMKISEFICLNVGDMNLLLCNGHPLFFSM